MGGAVHASSIIFDIFCIIESISTHICCHWFCDSVVLLCSRFVRIWIWFVFCSENLIQNLLMFYGGIGFNILGLLFDVGVCFFAIMLLGGIFRHIG
jgi:hypothetical protein